MRWLLLKDLQILRRSPLVSALLVIYPIVLAVLIGLAISRSPEKPRVAFLNQIPAGAGLNLGETGGFSQTEARQRLCAKIECVTATSRADVERKVKDGEVLGGLILPPDFLSKLQAELTTNSSEPAKVEVLVNQDDPLKAQIVDDRISTLLNQANLLLSDKIAAVAVNYEQLLANGGEFEIPFLNQTVNVLGLERSEQILRSVESKLPPAERAQVSQVAEFARLARQNLALANQLLSSIRQPIAVDKQVVSGSVPPLDTFAVAVAAAVTLLFVTVLLVSGSLA
ncbi:MAG TPA: ABC transporter permease, partial [Solirubrobacterales bacterium]